MNHEELSEKMKSVSDSIAALAPGADVRHIDIQPGRPRVTLGENDGGFSWSGGTRSAVTWGGPASFYLEKEANGIFWQKFIAIAQPLPEVIP